MYCLMTHQEVIQCVRPYQHHHVKKGQKYKLIGPSLFSLRDKYNPLYQQLALKTARELL